jgi:hypothetical protein
MDQTNFVDRVKKYFHVSEAEYGFRITRESNSDVRPQTDGMVEYTSNSLVVAIDSETGSATMWFYRPKDGKRFELDPVAIHEYLNTNETEKELLLSINPADKSAATVLFNEKFLLNLSGWKGNRGTVQDLDKELKNFSDWMREHASLCLNGDFSWWPKFCEYKIN